MASPHDKLFKATFSELEHARSVLATALPGPVSALVEWASLELVSGELVDARLAKMQSDLLFRARIGAHEAYLYVLFEHQSSPDRAMPLRLLRYMSRIWERLEREAGADKLPAIVPVVLHHGERRWTAPTRFGDLLDLDPGARDALAPFVPDFTFVLDDLAKVDDDALRARALTDLARLVLVVLSRARGADDLVAVLRPWTQTMLAVLAAPSGAAALATVARYIVEAGDAPPEELVDFFAELGPSSGEALVTTYDQLVERGRREGKLEGKAEGKLEGKLEGAAEVLIRLLTRRFGPLPPQARARVAAGSAAELERWAVRVLDAPSLDEALG
jgi:predicted transposase YdaD